MEFDELLISTGVDRLIKLVKQKGTIELTIAAKLLKVSIPNVQEWAQILEEEGLIKVKYHLTQSYLEWVEPTQEQIKQETESFYSERSDLVGEIDKIKKNLEPEEVDIKELKKSINSLYEKLAPKFKDLEEKTKGLKGTKTVPSTNYAKHISELKSLNGKISDLGDSVEFIKSQLEKLKQDFATKSVKPGEISSLNTIKVDITKLDDKLKTLEDRALKTIKGLPKGTISPMKFGKELENLKNLFERIKRENSTIRSIVRDLGSKGEVLKTPGKNIKKKHAEIQGLQAEMNKLSKQADSLRSNFDSFSKRLDAEKKGIAHLSEVMDLTKETLSGFSSPSELAKHLKELMDQEKAIQKKLSELEKNSKYITEIGDVVRDFDGLTKEIENKQSKLGEDAADIFKRLDEEGSTFKVFQTIKDRATSAIEEYNGQLATIKTELKEIEKNSKTLNAEMKKQYDASAGKVNAGEIGDLLGKLDKLNEKKELLEEVTSNLTSLDQKMSSINKRVALLSKEAKLIEIRGGTGKSSDIPVEQEEEIREEIRLTKDEEREFRVKRKELMGMIKKLWEEDS